MNHKLFVLVLVWCVPFSLLGQQGTWQWVNPYPTGNAINQVYFLNDQEGFVVGESGTLLRSSDGGVTWQQIEVPPESFLTKLLFVNAQKGWLLGHPSQYNGTSLFKTEDGGLSWSQLGFPTSSLTATDFQFTEEGHGWIVAENGIVYSTDDGGVTWNDRSINSPNPPYLLFVHFSSPTEGVVLGRGYSSGPTFDVARTTNGGASWDLQSAGIQNELRAADQIDSTTFVAVSTNDLILKSTDAGANWCFPMGLPLQNLTAVDFYNGNLGLAVGEAGNMVRTTDGGKSWQEILSGFTTPLSSVQFVNDSLVVAGGSQYPGYGGYGPAILRSSDGGETWTNLARYLEQVFPIYGFSFPTVSKGFIAGYNFIYQTSDGGVSWNLLRFNSSDDLRDIVFTDSLNGLAAGARNGQGLILRTTNGGASWQTQLFSSFSALNRLTYAAKDTAYAVGDAGAILRSYNGGQSWTRANSGTTNYLYDVEFINGRVGYVPDGNSILKTTNAGATWVSRTVTQSENLRVVTFPTPQIGYTSGDYSMHKTINGGASWTRISTPFSGTQDMIFSDSNRGWAVSYNGIMSTDDGGMTWQSEFFNLSGQFLRFGYVPNGELWVCGNSSSILRYSERVRVAIQESTLDEPPVRFALKQNYPNPFNPTTSINFEVPRRAHVSVKIFDLTGREVASLVEQVKDPGTYQVVWNAKGTASGVYFCRLRAGEFEQTKKMILAR